MRRAVSKCNKGMALAILFDMTGAFDNLKWSSILKELERRGTEKHLLRLIAGYLCDREVKIEEKYEVVTKKLTKGCPQGSILGPDLWNIRMDGLLNKLEKDAKATAYANDIIVIVFGNSRRELECNAQVLVDVVVEWSRKEGLQLSKDKTEMIMLKDTGMGKQPGN